MGPQKNSPCHNEQEVEGEYSNVLESRPAKLCWSKIYVSTRKLLVHQGRRFPHLQPIGSARKAQRTNNVIPMRRRRARTRNMSDKQSLFMCRDRVMKKVHIRTTDSLHDKWQQQRYEKGSDPYDEGLHRAISDEEADEEG